MAWYHRSRERLQRTPDGKSAPAPTKEQQETKLAEFEEFKPAPLAMNTDTNLPVVVAHKPAKQASAPVLSPSAPTPAVRTSTPIAAPAPQAKPAVKAPSSLAPKPAPQVARVTVTVGLAREEIAELKAKEAALEAKVNRARQDFKALAANEENAEKVYKEYPAYAKRLIGWVEEMVDMAGERADAAAASHYRRIIIEIRRDEPPKPKDEKPTFEQYMANPSRYKNKGKTGVSSGYHPTKKDLDKQPFQPIKGACTGWSAGYKASENCKNCRAMGEASGTHIHCPCGCGSYVPIDRNYDPFGGQNSPEFKEGKSSTRLW